MLIKRTRVLQLVEDLKIGGLERVIANIAEGLNKEKYKVSIWCLAYGGEIANELIDKEVDVKVLGIYSYYNLVNILRLAILFKIHQPYILHTHGYFASTMGRIAGKIAGVPIIITHVHSTYWGYNKRNLFIERILALFTYKIICVSNAVKNFVLNYEKISRDKVIVIYNGIGFSQFSIGQGNPAPTIPISADKKIVGTVASLTPHKGHKYLIESAKEVLDNFPNVYFLVVGDGPLRKSLEEQVTLLNISSNITFTGIRNDIFNLLSTFDIFVLPSLEREGLPISTIEAMASGLPIVATNIGGIPEVVQDGMNGFLVPPRDSHALATRIIELLKDKEKVEKMGAVGRGIFKQKFTSQTMVQEIERLYEEAIQNTLHLTFR